MTGPSVALGEWLDALSARTASPSGGSAAAVALAAAAALASMAARFSRTSLPDADVLVSTAEAARARALELAAQDEAAFGAVSTGDAGHAAALLRVATVPLEMVRLAAEMGPVLVRLAREGNERLRGDATVGIELLKAGAAGAAELVRIDAGALDDATRQRLLESLDEAERRLARALE